MRFNSTGVAGLILPLLLLLSVYARADTFGNFGYSVNTDGTSVTITSYSGTDSAVSIPSTINNLTVNTIGPSAFEASFYLSSITIPNTVTSIGDYAFSRCYGLDSVTLPSGLTSMGYQAFSESGLSSVTIPNGVATIGDDAFLFCLSLTSITIPGSVVTIGSSAFETCWNLASVTISKGVASIGDSAFYQCGLTSVTIPSSVTSIADSAFNSCGSLTNACFVGHTPSMGAAVFDNDASGFTIFYLNNATGFTSPTWTGYATDNIQYTAVNNAATITRFIGAGTVSIPATIASVPVTTIGNDAFFGCTALTGITIPTGVTSIGNDAFSGCTGLTRITIPGSVTSIGSNAFVGCTSLAGITIPSGITSIPDYAFWGCSSLANVTIPTTVTSIGDWAFYQCTTLTEVTIPNAVASIGDDAFYGCTGLTAVTIPASVTSIGDEAFSGCANLDGAYFQGSAPSMGTDVFDFTASDFAVYYFNSATGFTSPTWMDYPSSNIGYTVANGGVTITSFAGSGLLGIPDTIDGLPVTAIGDNAFAGCTSPASLTIPDTVTTIGNDAFSGCTGLIYLTIPSSVTSTGTDAFSGCTSLTSVYFTGNPPTADSSVFADDTSATVYYLPGALGWGTTFGGISIVLLPYTFTINNGGVTLTGYTGPGGNVVVPGIIEGYPVTNIQYAFTNSTSVTGVTIPSSVTSISAYAFQGCSNLSSVTIPNTVTSIGDWAFAWCNSLTNIMIPDGVTSIGGDVFYQCQNLVSITLPSTLTSMGGDIFYQCTSLASIAVPNGVTSIPDDAFYGCTSLASMTIPNSVTSIGEAAFYQCQSLTSVTIPDGVTTIGFAAFELCTGLTSIAIPDTVTTVDGNAFFDCSNLETAYFIGAAPTIGTNAFYGMPAGFVIAYFNNAQGFTTPSWNGYPTIDFNTTSANGQITITGYTGSAATVTIPGAVDGVHVTGIGSNAFSGNTSITNVTIPGSITSIGSGAFDGCINLVGAYFAGAAPSLGLAGFDFTAPGFAVYSYNNAQGFTSPTWNGYPAVEFNYTSKNGNVTIIGYTGSNNTVYMPGSINGLPVASIGRNLFQGCTNLVSVIIPNSVTSVGNDAFNGCTRLLTATMSSNLASIGDRTFANCTSLAGAYFLGNSPTVGSSVFSGDLIAIGYYQSGATGWESSLGSLPMVEFPFDYTVANNQISITGYAGPGGAVVIPSMIGGLPVTSIGYFAFYYALDMTSITIPDTVSSIGAGAFNTCTGLTSVTIPASVTSIGDYAFLFCNNLASAYFPGNAPTVGTGIFGSTAANFTVYYTNGAFGFSAPVWNGYTSSNQGAAVNFADAKGSYTGLADEGGTDAGLFTISVTAQGRFTAKLSLPGKQYPFKGVFTSNGNFRGTMKSGATTLNALLAINPSQSAISGTVTVASATGTSSFVIEGDLLGNYNARTFPAGLAGRYTIILPGTSGTDATTPHAPGYGALSITTSGAAYLAGVLGDGTPICTSGRLHSDGKSWTLFQPLYSGRNPGSIAGLVISGSTPNSDWDAALEWIKPAQTHGAYYRDGFSVNVDLLAAKYSARPLTSGTGEFALGGGDLPDSSITDELTISARNTVIVTGTENVRVTLDSATGGFSGTFLYPGTKRKTLFRGVIYQKPIPAGFGQFPGSDQYGTVEVVP